MGVFSNTGVSIGVEDTLPKGRGQLGILTDEIASWTHTSAAIGGYLTANCTVNADENYIDEWLESGLGRWLTLYDEGGNIRWRGFVDQITANIAGLSIQRGPMSGITNRCHMVYSTADNSTAPPTMGVRAVTTQTDDTSSQALYGIWQKVLSCSGNTQAGAVQDQAMYLQEYANPETTKTLTLGGGNLSMTLQLKGVWYWLGAFIANFTTAGTVNLSDRLIAILALDPNAVFSTDTSHITANTYQVAGFENDDKPGLKYINSLLTFGDAAFNRYTAGFYDNEIMYYVPAPSTILGTFSLSDPSQEVTFLGGVVQRPWEVQAAQWFQISDLMIGRVADANIRRDPRNIFVETLSFTAPYGLVLNGGKVATLPQILAQKGLGGIGSG